MHEDSRTMALLYLPGLRGNGGASSAFTIKHEVLNSAFLEFSA
jgi:hypothetical protein